MPTLFKRSNGIYYSVLTDESGTRKWISTGERLKSLALKKIPFLQETARRRRKDVLLLDFTKELIPFLTHTVASATVELYKRSLNRFLECTGNIALVEITARDVDLFKQRRLSRVKPVTVNIELRTLRSAFYTAVRWSHIEQNPFKGIKQCEIDDHSPVFFSKEDMARLLSMIPDDRFRSFVIIAALTGLRRGELLHLTWDDVDLDRRVINIQSKVGFRTKRGRRRVVPMNDPVVQRMMVLNMTRTGPYVFGDLGKTTSEAAVSIRFKRLVRRACLPDGLHLHSLRHSFASMLVKDGAPLFEVQKLLGHSNIKTTMVYAHLEPEQLHGTVKRLNSYISDPKTGAQEKQSNGRDPLNDSQ